MHRRGELNCAHNCDTLVRRESMANAFLQMTCVEVDFNENVKNLQKYYGVK